MTERDTPTEDGRPHTHLIVSPVADRQRYELHVAYGLKRIVKQNPKGGNLFAIMVRAVELLEADPASDFTWSNGRSPEQIVAAYWPGDAPGIRASITLPIGYGYAPDFWTHLWMDQSGDITGDAGARDRFVRKVGAAPNWRPIYTPLKCVEFERELIKCGRYPEFVTKEHWHRPTWRAKELLPLVFVEPAPPPNPQNLSFEQKRDAMAEKRRKKRRHEAIGRIARGETKSGMSV